ncbi:MAG: MBL fold metallo-hydrolase [bacterium]|nr:MBL fold metallo-hydrolase [bacterium]
MAHEVAERIYRLGADLVNWYVVEDGGRITVVDAGNPNQYSQLPAALAKLGRTMDDVDAIVLTHAHGDHLGSAAHIRDVSGADVHVHSKDVKLARGESHREYERHYIRDLGHSFAWKSLMFFLRGGATKAPPVHDLVEFAHGEVLDIPGSPRVIHTPGHTEGSACLEFTERDAVMSGDALVTLSIVTGERTPRIMPGSFNANSPAALESLNELRSVSAEILLPGHGEPWHGSIDAAVVLAQKTGAN